MAYLFGIWGCFIAFAAAALYRLIVVRRIRTEIGSQADPRDLLDEHKSRFPASRTRSLSSVLIAIQLIATVAGVGLGIAAQFQPHSLYHLISVSR
jgi:hypothetical protein